jgi:hypothetical protein
MPNGILKHGDLINPYLDKSALPPQWKGIPPELWEKLNPRRGFLTFQERDMLDRILKSEYLLLQNYWHFRCKQCNNIHEYYTIRCIERPFNRLSAIHGLIKDKEAELNGDLILKGISLGTVIPITTDEAQKLIWKIRFKGYPIS